MGLEGGNHKQLSKHFKTFFSLSVRLSGDVEHVLYGHLRALSTFDSDDTVLQVDLGELQTSDFWGSKSVFKSQENHVVISL